MATQCFLTGGNGPTTTLVRGENTAKLDGTNSGWTSQILRTTRGPSQTGGTATNTVAGPTSGVEIITSTLPTEFISPPVAADVTISGDITANIWAAENNSGANVAINVMIDIIRGNDMSIDNIVKSTRTTEVALTTRAVNNFTTGMTSGAYSPQTLNKGDRLRVRVFGDDAGTMASTFTFNASWNAASAGIDGDTYVTFTEDITFEDVGPPPTTQNLEHLFGARATNMSAIGVSGGEKVAQSFVPPFDFTLVGVAMTIDITGTPVDSLKVSVQTDSAGEPSGVILDSTTTAPDSFANTSSPLGERSGFVFTGNVTLSASTTYWLVCERTGALDAVNRWGWSGSSGTNDYGYPNGQQAVYTGASWSLLTNDKCFDFDLGNRIYLTDTASDVSTASVDREAWKSRGGGEASDVTNTVAGFTSPIQVTDTAGGTAVDWFTPRLLGFTLSGMAYFRVDGVESAVAANAALRVEIARVDADGTNPTVWATAGLAMLFGNSTNQGELGSVAADFFPAWAFCAGDDLVITDGQRLRLRIYIDDSQNALGASQTVTTYYGRDKPGGIGDTFVIFPQELEGLVQPQLVPGRRMSWFS